MILALRRYALVLAPLGALALVAAAGCLLDGDGGPDLCQVALAIASVLALAPLLEPVGALVPARACWRRLASRDLSPPPPRP
jgi:hypothetical protein